MTTHTNTAPKESFDTLCELGAELLQRVIAIDSQSDEDSDSIPSTEGQRRMSEYLEGYFRELGFQTACDEYANLLVDIPGNRGKGEDMGEGGARPKLAFMVHMDTSRGTRAVPRLETLAAWDGSAIPYPENPRLAVSVDHYPETRTFLGQDLLFGPGQRAFGLDDKLGMSEMMLLAHLLGKNPDIERPDIVLVARPDEEIGRMAAVEGLAAELARRGVTHGYTIDGLDPFEINTENFNAALARVFVRGQPLALPAHARARLLVIDVQGAKSHGATARAEGYLNATMVLARVFEGAGKGEDDAMGRNIIPVGFASDATAETDAELCLLLLGDDDAHIERLRELALARFEQVLAPHDYKGAGVRVREVRDVDAGASQTDEVVRLVEQLRAFLRTPGPEPLLSEDSDGYQGYSNPCFVAPVAGGLELRYRLRDFSAEGLAARKAHVRAVCAAVGAEAGVEVEIQDQYINMGPALAPHPELVEWAEAAARAISVDAVRAPIRGGTGVDPFLAAGIPIANLGTGYFAPESEKEFTSRQMIARHALWLCQLVQVVARA